MGRFGYPGNEPIEWGRIGPDSSAAAQCARVTPIPKTIAMLRVERDRCFEQLLDAVRLRDYCPNGLKVEGRREIASIASATIANLAPMRS